MLGHETVIMENASFRSHSSNADFFFFIRDKWHNHVIRSNWAFCNWGTDSINKTLLQALFIELDRITRGHLHWAHSLWHVWTTWNLFPEKKKLPWFSLDEGDLHHAQYIQSEWKINVKHPLSIVKIQFCVRIKDILTALGLRMFF